MGRMIDRWPGPEELGRALIARYQEPHRRYHTLDHLAQVLDRIDELAPEVGEAVRVAAWFHDAVYDPLRSDNEERSAALAEATLPGTGLNAAVTAEVARLVRLTAEHRPAPEDFSGAVLCDADLAILGAEPRRYAAYAATVREEYAAVPQEAFRQGRADVLRRLLDRPALFTTPYGHELWEAAARRNVQGELLLLT